jgi:hypothetical protein
MLRRDATASFHKSGAWIFSRYRFVAGAIQASSRLNRAAFDRLMTQQQGAPVLILEDEDRRRTCWLFRDEFYWEDEDLNQTEVKAMLLERLTQKGRRIKRAVALMDQSEAIPDTSAYGASSREPIRDDVKLFVWQRDRGRCVRCGAQERLEFDHVIPLSLGGANTARNLQLLCEPCNRAKGAALA